MLISRLYPRTWAALGALLYLGLGFALARAPWVSHHFIGSMGFGLAALALLAWVGRRESRQEPLRAHPKAQILVGRALAWAFGLGLAWLLVLGTGLLRYRVTDARVDASGLRPPYPLDDLNDPSRANGQVILQDWAASKGAQALLADEGLKADMQAALAAAGGRRDGLAGLMKVLQARRARWRGALKAVDQAQKAPHFSWNVRYNGVPFYQVELPPFAPIRRLGLLLGAEALLLRAEGKDQAALGRLAQLFWLARMLRLQPSLQACFVRFDLEQGALDALTPFLVEGRGARLLAALPSDSAESLDQAFRLEFLQGPPSLRARLLQGPFGGGLQGALFSILDLPFSDWDIAASLDSQLALVQALRQPWAHSASADAQALMARIQDEGWTLQALRFPDVSGFPYRAAARLAHQDLAGLCLQAGRYKRKHKHWPATMKALLGKGGPAQDPYTGQAYRLSLQGKRLELRCLGGDGKPDLGAPTATAEAARDLWVKL